MSKEKKDQVEEQKTLEVSADRVVYGASRKISDGHYGSYDFHCSFSTDVKPEEKPGDTVNRSIKFVETVLNHKVTQQQQKKIKY